MPNGQHNINLTVQVGNSYQFIGGNNGNGNCSNSVGQGAAPVLVTLVAPAGYKITSVDLTGTGADQMQTQVAGQGQSATIANPCTKAADVDYTVNVSIPGGGNLACHPKIVNT